MNVNLPIQIDQQNVLTFGQWKLPLEHATKFTLLNDTSIRLSFKDPAAIKDLDLLCKTAAKTKELADQLLKNQIPKEAFITDKDCTIIEINGPNSELDLFALFSGKRAIPIAQVQIIDLNAIYSDETKVN